MALRKRNNLLPPTRVQNPTYRRMIRYHVDENSQGTIAFTHKDLFKIMCSTTVSPWTTGVPLFGAVRILRVVIWGAGTSTTESLSFAWKGGTWGVDKEYTATGTVSIPSHMNVTPPKDSEASWWWTLAVAPNTAVTLFEIKSAVVDTMVDIEFEAQFRQGSELGTYATVSGPTALGVFYGILATYLTPFGLPTITVSAFT